MDCDTDRGRTGDGIGFTETIRSPKSPTTFGVESEPLTTDERPLGRLSTPRPRPRPCPGPVCTLSVAVDREGRHGTDRQTTDLRRVWTRLRRVGLMEEVPRKVGTESEVTSPGGGTGVRRRWKGRGVVSRQTSGEGQHRPPRVLSGRLSSTEHGLRFRRGSVGDRGKSRVPEFAGVISVRRVEVPGSSTVEDDTRTDPRGPTAHHPSPEAVGRRGVRGSYR